MSEEIKKPAKAVITINLDFYNNIIDTIIKRDPRELHNLVNKMEYILLNSKQIENDGKS